MIIVICISFTAFYLLIEGISIALMPIIFIKLFDDNSEGFATALILSTIWPIGWVIIFIAYYLKKVIDETLNYYYAKNLYNNINYDSMITNIFEESKRRTNERTVADLSLVNKQIDDMIATNNTVRLKKTCLRKMQ